MSTDADRDDLATADRIVYKAENTTRQTRDNNDRRGGRRLGLAQSVVGLTWQVQNVSICVFMQGRSQSSI